MRKSIFKKSKSPVMVSVNVGNYVITKSDGEFIEMSPLCGSYDLRFNAGSRMYAYMDYLLSLGDSGKADLEYYVSLHYLTIDFLAGDIVFTKSLADLFVSHNSRVVTDDRSTIEMDKEALDAVMVLTDMTQALTRPYGKKR